MTHLALFLECPFSPNQTNRKNYSMLYTIALILVIMWILGMITGYTIGSFIHILLVIAVIIILVNFISGRRTR